MNSNELDRLSMKLKDRNEMEYSDDDVAYSVKLAISIIADCIDEILKEDIDEFNKTRFSE